LGVPVAPYRVEVFVAWFEVQNGLVAEKDMPQGFLRFESVTGASPGTLETKFVCLNASGRAFRETRKNAENSRIERLEKRLGEHITVNLRE